MADSVDVQLERLSGKVANLESQVRDLRGFVTKAEAFFADMRDRWSRFEGEQKALKDQQDREIRDQQVRHEQNSDLLARQNFRLSIIGILIALLMLYIAVKEYREHFNASIPGISQTTEARASSDAGVRQ